MPSSWRRDRSHESLVVVDATKLYSAFIENRAIGFCFLDDQEIKSPPR